MSRIFVTGDTHGMYDRKKLNAKEFKEQKILTKDDFVIIVGDVAMRWDNTKSDGKLSPRDRNMIEWYENKNFTTLFIDGNHENHKALNAYPTEIWNGGKIHRLSDSVIHLMRGQVYKINDKKFFTMGGADSIDKMYRIKDESWWEEEMPSKYEYEEAINNLDKNNMTVDYVLTHCCGTSYLNDLFTAYFDQDELTQFLNHLEFDFGLKFKHWYFGHHHQDKQIDEKHTCLYQNIIEIKET